MMVERFMHQMSRHACLALLLALLFSHTSVAVHAAVHEMGDSVECQLCSSSGNVMPPASSAENEDLRWNHEPVIASASPVLPCVNRVAPLGQRGPPPLH